MDKFLAAIDSHQDAAMWCFIGAVAVFNGVAAVVRAWRRF